MGVFGLAVMTVTGVLLLPVAVVTVTVMAVVLVFVVTVMAFAVIVMLVPFAVSVVPVPFLMVMPVSAVSVLVVVTARTSETFRHELHPALRAPVGLVACDLWVHRTGVGRCGRGLGDQLHSV